MDRMMPQSVEKKECGYNHRKKKAAPIRGRGFLLDDEFKPDRATSQLLPGLQPCRRAGGNRLA